jgi:general secretion pathway protein E
MLSEVKIPYTFAKRHGVLVKAYENDEAIVVHRDNLTSSIILELQRVLPLPCHFQSVTIEEFDNLLTQFYQDDTSAKEALAEFDSDFDLNQLVHELPRTEDLLESQDDAPIIRLLNAIFTQAIKQHASDIHIESYEEKVIIRFRMDGVLQEIVTLARALAPLIISRIKVMARLDISEKRIPQDGRMNLRIAGHSIDVRVSTLPANHGERLVLRLLDKKVTRLDLSSLGMAADGLSIIQKLIAQPHGLILVTGPTGSGKTTSLYAMLSSLNHVSRNILTVEDPIEFDLVGIGQTQVNTKIDMSFARGLRAILRQDPDVIMVGEIRDLETAEISVQASLTGHLVLSTLHTNTAIGAITRLRDMGVAPFLLASSLIGVIAQRLVRLLCIHCKKPREITAIERDLLNTPKKGVIQIFEPQACEQCLFTGYQGRMGIYELIPIDKELQNMIHNDASEQTMDAYARTKTINIVQDGFRQVLNGVTTIAEVLRVASEI